LVADIRIREGKLSFPVTLPEIPGIVLRVNSGGISSFICCDIITVTIVKAKDLWKYLKERIRLIEE